MLSHLLALCPSACAHVLHATTAADAPDFHYFSTDDTLVYDPYFGDFGPLNVSQICRYCKLLEAKMKDAHLSEKRLVQKHRRKGS